VVCFGLELKINTLSIGFDMQDTLIKVDKLSKAYPYKGQSIKSDALHWALNDVSFSLKKGQSTALIGRNGSGKSTLLKIIAGILTPTSGQVCIAGRMITLLEPNAGFHSDLTGRENIYVFGAMMGLKRKEIRENFDQIVGFSEIHDFIDQKVRRYSSGMVTRLAFSIAATIQPDILIADEILAVIDNDFQAKCLKRMNEMKRNGVAILLVDHDLDVVSSVCEHAILLNDGTVAKNENTTDVIAEYHARR